MTFNQVHMARNDTIITASQLKNLRNEPVSLLSCPPDSVLIPHRAACVLNYLGSPYSVTSTKLIIQLNNIMLNTLNTQLFSSTENSGCLVNIKDVTYTKISSILTQDIWLKNTGSKDLSGGNGILKTIIWYSVFTMD